MKPHGQRHEAWPKDKDTKEESEAHQAVQNSTHRRYIPGPATFVVSCEMACFILVGPELVLFECRVNNNILDRCFYGCHLPH